MILAASDFSGVCEVFVLVYLIRNTINGKCYVGQTTRDLEQRWYEHCLLHGKCRALENAIRKYGADAFEVSVVARVETQDALNVLEKVTCAALNTYAPHGYNLREGGNAAGKMHEQTRQLLRELALKPERIEILREITARPEVRAKTTASKIRYFADPEWKSKTLAAMQEGRTPESEAARKAKAAATWRTPEVRQAQSERQQEIQARPEVKAKKSESLRENWAWLSDEERKARGDAISAGATGVPKTVDYSPEAKAKRSVIAKEKWASNPEMRENMAKKFEVLLADPAFLKKRGDAIGAAYADKAILDPEWAERRTEKMQATWAEKIASRTHCKNGHELTEGNIHILPTGKPQCKLCRAESVARFRELHPKEKAMRQVATDTHCKHGHVLVEDNVYIVNGKRKCATCARAATAKARAKAKRPLSLMQDARIVDTPITPE
jgi:group I intron endonuclease